MQGIELSIYLSTLSADTRQSQQHLEGLHNWLQIKLKKTYTNENHARDLFVPLHDIKKNETQLRIYSHRCKPPRFGP